ncbi:Ku protein [Kitasatospora sp. NPDC017646]|uniref:Ku protein n=1 Tax=Kitasatospora sp. NPDC017646 TaxID=3364024 RepID=UPI0037997951
MDGLDEVAAALYAVPPSEFTAARDRAVAEARNAGDRQLAARIKALRRPTASAFAVNRLVRVHPEQVSALLELGVALRRAQGELAGAALRDLSARRHHLVAALTGQARDAAADAGVAVGEAQLREVERTLRAALADADAAAEFAAGSLSTALEEPSILPAAFPTAHEAADEAADGAAEAEEPVKPRSSARTGRPVQDRQGVRTVGGPVRGGRAQGTEELSPGRGRTIEISGFVDLADVEPIYFDRTYYVAPSAPEHTKVYQLLTRALTRSNRAGLALFSMRGKEYRSASWSRPRPRDGRSPSPRAHRRRPPTSSTSWRCSGRAWKPPAAASGHAHGRPVRAARCRSPPAVRTRRSSPRLNSTREQRSWTSRTVRP